MQCITLLVIVYVIGVTRLVDCSDWQWNMLFCCQKKFWPFRARAVSVTGICFWSFCEVTGRCAAISCPWWVGRKKLQFFKTVIEHKKTSANKDEAFKRGRGSWTEMAGGTVYAVMKQQLWQHGQQTWLASLIHPSTSLESYLLAYTVAQ